MAVKNSVAKTYTLDFEKDHLLALSMIPQGNVITRGPFYTSYNLAMPLNNYSPTSIQNYDGYLYLWKTSDYVYKTQFSRLEWTSSNIYTTTPKIIRVKHNGADVDLLFNETRAEIIGQGVVTLRGKRYVLCAICNDVFFTSDKKDLYFSDKFTDADVAENLYTRNFIKMDESYGNVFYLHAYKNNLYVVCEKAFLILNVGENLSDYKFIPVKTMGVSIIEKSICADEEKLFFISDNFLYYYDGEKFTKKDFFPQDCYFISRGRASYADGCYVWAAQIQPINLYYSWYYDFVVDRAGMVELMDTYADKGGHAYNKTKNIIRRFVRKTTLTTSNECEFESKPVNFGTTRNKRLTLIEFTTANELTLTVTGDFGSVKVRINGATAYKCNLVSKTFTFKFTCISNCLPAENLKLKYNVLGE